MFSHVVIPDLVLTKNHHLEVILSKSQEFAYFRSQMFATIKQQQQQQQQSIYFALDVHFYKKLKESVMKLQRKRAQLLRNSKTNQAKQLGQAK